MLYAWIDLETTGFDNNRCSICEIACIITDDNFDEEKEKYHRIIDSQEAYWQPGALAIHQGTGLYDEMEGKPIESQVMLDFSYWLWQRRLEIAEQTGQSRTEVRFNLAGSSVHFDREFLIKKWPDGEEVPRRSFYKLFTHRNLDVSSVQLAIASLCGEEIANEFDEEPGRLESTDHRAMDDIRRSIGKIKHYRDQRLVGG